MDPGQGTQYPHSDYELLHRALSTMCSEEWVDFDVLQGDRVWARMLRPLVEPAKTAHRSGARQPPAPDPRAVQQVLDAMLPHDPVDDAPGTGSPHVLCVRCNTPIFCRYYTCALCDTAQSRCVYCLRCVLEGSRCDHIKSLRVRRIRRLAPLRAMAAALAAREPGRPPPPLVLEPDRNKVSLATACFMLVGTAKEDLLVTCHQCKLSKFICSAMCCRNTTEDCSRRRPFTRRCTKKYCWSCLWNRYSLQPSDCLTLKQWVCPACQGVCNCKACLRKREGPSTSGHRRAQAPLAESQSPDKRPCTNDPSAVDTKNTGQTPESFCSPSNSDDISRSPGPESSPNDTPSFLSPTELHGPEQPKPPPPAAASSTNDIVDQKTVKTAGSAAKTTPASNRPPVTYYMARVGPFSCEYLARVCRFSRLFHRPLKPHSTLHNSGC